MVGKFLLVAILCVSLAQVQGNELENAITSGLKKARGLYEAGQKKIDLAIKEVDYKTKTIEAKSVVFIQKSISVQDGARQALRNVAQAMEEKAKEIKRPESVFECIRKAEQNANNQIRTLTEKFKTDIERLEKVKLANIKTDSKPLFRMQEALTVRYQRANKIIKSCQTPSCVDTAVKSWSTWLEQIYADIRRILGQVATIVGNFGRDASNYFNNSNRQIIGIKSSTVRNIRRCVFNRNAFFEEY